MSDNLNKVTVQFIGDSSQLERTMKQVSNSLNHMNESVGKSMFKAMAGFELLKSGLKMVGGATKGGIEDAVKYEAMMDNLSRTLGNSANDFVTWSETVGKSLGFSKLQSASFGSELTLMLKGTASSQEDLTKKTTDMMKAVAIISAKTGRSMQDVMQRTRSAMNMEADGADELGINVRASAIKQSEAYKKMADGKPWAELTSNQQKAILYQHILNSTTQNFGDSIGSNMQTQLMVFTANLANLKLALGQAFLPILNVVLPLLSRMIGALTVAMKYVVTFMEVLFGYSHKAPKSDLGTDAVKKHGSALADTAGKQGKLTDAINKTNKAKKDANKGQKNDSLENFDEITKLPKPPSGGDGAGGAGGGSGSGAGGAGGGLDLGDMGSGFTGEGGLISSLDKASAKAKEFAENFKKFMQPVFDVGVQIYDAVKTYILDTFKGMNEWWNANGDVIGKGFKNLWDNFLYPVLSFLVEMIWGSVKGAIDGLVGFFEGLLQFVGGVFAGEWGTAFEGIWKMVKGAFEFIWNAISILFLADCVGAIKGGLSAIKKVFTDLFTKGGSGNLLKVMDDAWISMKSAVTKFLEDIRGYFSKGWTNIKADMTTAWSTVKTFFTDKLLNPIKGVLDSVKSNFTLAGQTAWSNLKAGFSNASSWFKTNVATPIKNAFNNITAGGLSTMTAGIRTFINNKVRPPINSALKFADSIPGVNIGWRMPQLYNGGITNGKMIAQIGDNVGGQEVVAPLDRLNKIIARTMADTMNWNGGGSGGGATEIVLKVGSTEFGRVAVDSINKLTKQEGRLGINI